VVAFGKTAEHIEKYYHKGMKTNICGHIQTGSYEGKNGKVYTTDVVIDEIEFGESKGESKDESRPEKPDDGDFMNVPDDDELPFH
jgi:single-strand DNA-binding protein